MPTDFELATQRFAVFAEQVLRPAIYPATAPLTAGAFVSPAAVALADVMSRKHDPVEIGWRFGPVWSTAWFHLRGTVPMEFAGRCVSLRFSSGTEALLWQDGQPRHGLDANHDTVILFPAARGGENVDLRIEAACNRPLGATLFWWDEPETRARWNAADPGRLERCELCVFDHEAWRFFQAYEFARQLLSELPHESEHARRLLDGLRAAALAIDDRNVSASIKPARANLDAALHDGGAAAQSRCIAVGHAHIDTAWLWPLRETRRKCVRTFSTVLDLMDRFPDFRFIATQAQQYAYVRADAPALFDRIAAQVHDGRWEPGGGMWIEPDCNVPSGESLIRQIMHGTRYFREAFGDAAKTNYVYLPDTFGFPASLPQIFRLAGLHTFITNKLWWSDANEFPHVSFTWRGIDGTELLSHCTPGRDYNCLNSPTELLRGARTAARLDKSRAGVWLQPFGHGDGGGGPTAETIERASLAENAADLPRVSLGRMDDFCAELHRRRDELADEGREFPVWDGELYLEYHRGTLTTHSWLKHANRRAEYAMFNAEWLAVVADLAARSGGNAASVGRDDRVNAAWKTLLLNQFHDILPGSSITAVYDDARRDHAAIRATTETVIEASIAQISNTVNTAGMAKPMLVLNPASTSFTGIVTCDGEQHFVRDVPPLSVRVWDRDKLDAPHCPVTVSPQALENAFLRADIDAIGRIACLTDVGTGRIANERRADGTVSPINQLVLYDDRPRFWEAWDIDAEYEEKAWPVDSADVKICVVEHGPLRGAIEVARPLGHASRLVQTYTLDADSPRLDIVTRIDWHEDRRLLRALFPVNVRARFATYDIQFGHIQRPTFRNTSWDRAMFEVCAHKWMDLSAPGFGVALLNDGRYGHSCHGNVMGLSLLRSPMFPDPAADRGVHEFTYSLVVHDGDWRAGGVDHDARRLNNPAIARPLPTNQAGPINGSLHPFTIGRTGGVDAMVASVKHAERGDRLIVRIVEINGGRGGIFVAWKMPVRAVESLSVLEEPIGGSDIPPVAMTHDAAENLTTIELRPFQIITLGVTLA